VRARRALNRRIVRRRIVRLGKSRSGRRWRPPAPPSPGSSAWGRC
jgi:hypothetical protein